MKTKNIISILLVLLIGSQIIKVNAQGNNYKLDGNNNGTSSSKLGFTNNADLRFVTNDSVRQIITKDGNVIIEKDLHVKGMLSSDVMKFSNNMFADSLNAQVIKVGNNSIWLGTWDQFTGTDNNISADNGPCSPKSFF